MDRVEKIYQDALNSSSNISLRNLCYLLEATGFELRRSKGSHKIYKHPQIKDFQDAMMPVQEGENGKAKSYQVEQVLEIIEKYGLLK